MTIRSVLHDIANTVNGGYLSNGEVMTEDGWRALAVTARDQLTEVLLETQPHSAPELSIYRHWGQAPGAGLPELVD